MVKHMNIIKMQMQMKTKINNILYQILMEEDNIELVNNNY
jgi:hypothetical protein